MDCPLYSNPCFYKYNVTATNLPVRELLLLLAEQVPVQSWVLEQTSESCRNYCLQGTTIATSLYVQ